MLSIHDQVALLKSIAGSTESIAITSNSFIMLFISGMLIRT